MSDDGSTKKANTGWTDAERLVYLVALVKKSGVKFDFKTTPRPEGRSVIACQRMIERLQVTYKAELEALEAGKAIGDATPKKKGAAGDNSTPKSTPRKRKSKSEANEANGDEADGEGSPKKRGRKKKAEPEIKAEAEDEEEEAIKVELEEV